MPLLASRLAAELYHWSPCTAADVQVPIPLLLQHRLWVRHGCRHHAALSASKLTLLSAEDFEPQASQSSHWRAQPNKHRISC